VKTSVWSEASQEVRPGQVRVGLKWTGGALLVSRVIRFAATVVLARLLAPDLFGLVALASAVMNVMSAAREVGFGHAYVQRRVRDLEDARRTASTTFVVLLAGNAALFAVGQAAAPWFAGFFERSEEIVPVLRVMLVAFLLEAFLAMPGFVLQKRLEFGRHSASEVIGTASYGAIAVSLAFLGMGVWSLVLGDIGSRIVQAAVLAKVSGWRPSFRFDVRIARELFAFGKYLWAFAAVSMVGGVVDRLVLGGLYGAESVGLYGLALGLCSLPATQISALVNRVAFPALSRLQDDRGALGRAFRKALSHVSILSFPVTLGLYAVAAEFIRVVYGPAWDAAAPALEVLAFYAMVLAVSSVAGPVFQAIGRPQILLYTSLVHHAVLFGGMFALAGYGLVGIAWAVLIPHVVSAGIAFVLAARHLDLRAGAVIEPLLRAGTSALGMMGAVKTVQWGLRHQGVNAALPTLLVSVAVGVLAYLVLSTVVNRSLFREFGRTARQVATARRGDV